MTLFSFFFFQPAKDLWSVCASTCFSVSARSWTSKRTLLGREAFLRMRSTQLPPERGAGGLSTVPMRWRYVLLPWCYNLPLECSTAPSDRRAAGPPRSSSTSVSCFETIGNLKTKKTKYNTPLVSDIPVPYDAQKKNEFIRNFWRSHPSLKYQPTSSK